MGKSKLVRYIARVTYIDFNAKCRRTMDLCMDKKQDAQSYRAAFNKSMSTHNSHLASSMSLVGKTQIIDQRSGKIISEYVPAPFEIVE